LRKLPQKFISVRQAVSLSKQTNSLFYVYMSVLIIFIDES
jgi:hypothetical protein